MFMNPTRFLDHESTTLEISVLKVNSYVAGMSTEANVFAIVRANHQRRFPLKLVIVPQSTIECA